MIDIFIDTDVVLDLFLDRAPHVDNSAKIFQLASNGIIKLFSSVTTFTNSYYILSRLTSHADVRKKIRFLESRITVLNSDHSIVKQAVYSRFSDFEDAVQHFTAKDNKMDILLTRNIKDFEGCGIQLLNPFDESKN